MPSQRAVHYREQAANLREMAKTSPARELAEKLLEIADQYDSIAERLEVGLGDV